MDSKTTGNKTLIKWLFIAHLFVVCSVVVAQDTTLQYPISNPLDPTLNTPQSFDFGDPSSVEQSVVYDPLTGKYIFTERLSNGLYFRYPSMMTLEEYLEYERKKSTTLNWQKKIEEKTHESVSLYENAITIAIRINKYNEAIELINDSFKVLDQIGTQEQITKYILTVCLMHLTRDDWVSAKNYLEGMKNK